jgi:cold shock CspA family protein
MRVKGKITHWNGQKGYGFITPSVGEKQVFVHISSFQNRRTAPQLNQLVEFSLSKDKQGRPCAVNVARTGEQARKKKKSSNQFWSLKSAAVLLVVITIAVALAYSKYRKSQAGSFMPLKASDPSPSISRPPPQFSCDGRMHCSQMTSCAEAKFFIQNCPNTKMDGDGDGVPCESQWCSH